MNDNFKLYKEIKDLSFDLIEYEQNIPKKFMYIRENMHNSFSNSIKLVRYYVVNMNDTNRVKIKYLKDLVVEISMIDYYLECLFRFKVLGKNRYNTFANRLEDIRKLTYGVISSEKK